MKVVIPMSGMGQRFVDAGYFMPKPLIGVGGKMIIEYIVDMFDKKNDDFVFIVNNLHIIEYGIDKAISQLVPSATIVAIDPHKYGPVYAVQAAYQHINDDDEVIVAYCDNPHVWDYDDFKKHIQKNNLDGCILTHTGFHPHRLNSTRMAYLKVDDQNRLLEIRKKQVIRTIIGQSTALQVHTILRPERLSNTTLMSASDGTLPIMANTMLHLSITCSLKTT